MSSQQADPEPTESTGLEPGGGVPPGETPPAESSTTIEAGRPDPQVSSGPWKVIGIVLVALFAIAMLIFWVGYLAGFLWF